MDFENEDLTKYLLIKTGIRGGRRYKFLDGFSDIFIEMLKSGYTIKEICKKFKIKNNDVYKRWKRENPEYSKECDRIRKILGRKTEYKINHDYFKNIDNQYKAYWLGMIWADGSVKNLRVELCLNENDLHIMKLYKSHIESEHPIHKKKNNFYMQFNSKIMVNDLAYYNIVNRKSYKNLPVVNIPAIFIFHFLRGVFDGDGCISLCGKKQRPSLVFSGSKNFGNWIQQQMNLRDFNFHIYSNSKTGNCYNSTLYKKKQIQTFFNLLYEDAEIFMVRKYKKFLDCGFSIENQKLSDSLNKKCIEFLNL